MSSAGTQRARLAIASAFALGAAAWIDFAASEVVNPHLPIGHIETADDRAARHLLFAFPLIGFVAIAVALAAFFAARQRAMRRWALAAAYAGASAPLAFFVLLVHALQNLN